MRVDAHDGRFLAWAAYSRARRSACAPGVSTKPSASTPRSSPADRARCRAARAPADRQRRRAPGARRIRWPAGRDRRPLRRQLSRAVPVRRRRALDADDRRRAAARHRRRAPLRAQRPACASSKGWRRTGWLRGERRHRVTIREHRALASTSPSGHKTGFYLDQRDNRQLVRRAVRQFGCAARAELLLLHRRLQLAALAGGAAHVTASIPRRRRWSGRTANVALNGFDARAPSALDADVNAALRALPRRRPALRRHRARPAEVRADRRACRARRARLQGHQPAGAASCWRRAACW